MADKTLRFLLLGEDKTASKTLKGVGTEAKKTGGVLGALGGKMKAGLVGIAAALTVGEVVDFGKASVDAFMDAEKSQRALTDAYRRFPAIQSVAIGALRAYNEELQRKTGADADDLAASQAVLARYKLTGDQLKSMTPLLIDYATRTGKDLPTAAGTLGKALMGNKKAMKELGIKFEDTGDPAKNFQGIMEGLRTTVGGYAEKEATTAAGKTKILNARLGDLQEGIGSKLVPVLEKLLDKGLQVLDWLDANPKAVKAASAAFDGLVAVVEFVAGAIGLVFGPVIENAARSFAMFAGGVADALDQMGDLPGFGWAKGAAKALRGAAEGAQAVADGIREIGKVKPKFPRLEVDDKATAKVKNLTDRIKALKGKRVKAEAKGDTKEVDRLNRRIKELRNKRVTVQANVVKTGISTIRVQAMRGASDRVSVRAYASGGRPKVGQLAMFHADELWVPDTAGTVLTKAQTRRAMGGPAPLASGSAGTGGGDVFQISVNGDTDPDAAARRIEELLYRRRQRAGRLKFL